MNKVPSLRGRDDPRYTGKRAPISEIPRAAHLERANAARISVTRIGASHLTRRCESASRDCDRIHTGWRDKVPRIYGRYYGRFTAFINNRSHN